MQVSAGAKLTTGLARATWEAIFEISDGTHRLAPNATETELRSVAHCDRVVQRVTFFPDVDEWTPYECRRKVSVPYARKLGLTYCLATASEVLLESFASCLELCCANLVAEPPALFRLLSRSLVHLKVLRWSLYEDGRYESWLEKDAVADIGTHCQPQTLNPDTIYVELVETPLTADFLNDILNVCDDQQRPHIRVIRKDAVVVPIGNAGMMLKTGRPGLRSFRYTCEWVRPPATSLCPEASYSFVRPEDDLEQRASLQRVSHAVVAVEVDSEAACRFFIATTQPECQFDVMFLSLVLWPQPQLNWFERPPSAARHYLKPMRKFLQKRVVNICELKLTTSHFSLCCNFCLVMGPVLSRLRSQELPRRTIINCEDSLICLVRGCWFLEELDVSNGETLPCAACKVPLMFTERDLVTG